MQHRRSAGLGIVPVFKSTCVNRPSAVQALVLLLLTLAICCGTCTGQPTVGRPAVEDSQLLPWEFKGREDRFRWEGLHNDLGALLKVQAKDNAVAVLIFNQGFAGLALNCIVSLVRFAKAHNYIVAAVGDGSVQHCEELRLPCYNASAAVESKATDGDAGRNTQDWYTLVWAKTLVTDAIFEMGYDVLFTDADVVFIKEAFPAYNRLLDRFDADGTFMQEARVEKKSNNTTSVNRYFNSGNFFLRNNFRTRHMMTEWMVGYFKHGDKNGNQLWLNWMKDYPGQPYGICYTREECTALKNKGVAAMKPHPSQFDGRAQMCLPARFNDICSDRRLYVHAVCKSGGHAKKTSFTKLGLWFVHIFSLPDDIEVSVPSGSGLPCPSQKAWEDSYDAV